MLKAAIICLVLIGCTGGYQPMPVGQPTFPPLGYAIMCAEYPNSISCRGLVGDLHDYTDSQFTYMSDRDQFNKPEHWQSFVNKLLQGKPFQGDCDNFAVSLAELMILEGVPPDLVWLAFGIGKTGHLVAIFNGWVYDNARREVYRWDETGYEWVKAMRMDERIWRTMQ